MPGFFDRATNSVKNMFSSKSKKQDPVVNQYGPSSMSNGPSASKDTSLKAVKELSGFEQLLLAASVLLVLYLLYTSFTGRCDSTKKQQVQHDQYMLVNGQYMRIGHRRQCRRCGNESFQSCKVNSPGDQCCTKCQNPNKYSDADTPYNAANCSTCRTNYGQVATGTNKYALANCNARYDANKAVYDGLENDSVKTDARICGCLNSTYKFRSNNPNINWTTACQGSRPTFDNYQLSALVGVAKGTESKTDKAKRMKCILAKTGGNEADDSSYASGIINDCVKISAASLK